MAAGSRGCRPRIAQRYLPIERRCEPGGAASPRWDLIKGRRYGKAVTIATRGCPHRCGYCSIPILYGPGRVRFRPIAEVAAEVRRAPTRAVVFWDDNIGAHPRYAKDLFRALVPLRKWWTSQCTLRAAQDDEFLELAARSGCQALFLGLECRRLKGSGAGLWWNAPRNLGYQPSLRQYAFRGWNPAR